MPLELAIKQLCMSSGCENSFGHPSELFFCLPAVCEAAGGAAGRAAGVVALAAPLRRFSHFLPQLLLCRRPERTALWLCVYSAARSAMPSVSVRADDRWFLFLGI